MVVVVTGDAGEFKGAFHHAERGVAVAVHDAVRQRAMVGADPHGAAEILAQQDQRGELLADALEFLVVLGIAVFADGELFLIGVIAGVDADFFDPFGGFEGGVGFEMDVGDERDVAAGGTDFAGDVLEIGGVGLGLGGDADDFAADLRQAQDFGDASRGVAGVGGDHRLHADRVRGAHGDVAHPHLAGRPAGVGEKVGAIGQRR